MYESDLEADLLELEGPLEEGDPFWGALLGAAVPMLTSLLGEEEAYEDGLGEFELLEGGLEEDEAEVLMELIAEQMAEADLEEEGDAFWGALAASLAPLAVKAAKKLVPAAIQTARRVIPRLARGLVGTARRLARSPAGRQLVRTLPTIAKGAAADVLRTAAAGRPVSTTTVGRALARNTARVLKSPRRRRACIHRHLRVVRRVKPRLARAAREAELAFA
ncbi:MAG TPA: hypothetical protein ENK19_02275 [Acidobacteria bacterium]|nr:hypothetical protein [Acidobacteriota bacterium]